MDNLPHVQTLSETIMSSFGRATPIVSCVADKPIRDERTGKTPIIDSVGINMLCRDPGGPLGMWSLWPRLLAN